MMSSPQRLAASDQALWRPAGGGWHGASRCVLDGFNSPLFGVVASKALQVVPDCGFPRTEVASGNPDESVVYPIAPHKKPPVPVRGDLHRLEPSTAIEPDLSDRSVDVDAHFHVFGVTAGDEITCGYVLGVS